MAPQESSLGEKDQNLEPPPRGTSPAAGGGSGESQLCGIPLGEKAADAVEEEGEGAGAAAAADTAGEEEALAVVAVREKEQDNGASEEAAAAGGSKTDDGIHTVASGNNDDDDDDGYHTPTSPRHRIPPAVVCPPAPRKPASVRMRTPPQRRPMAVVDLDTKLLVARWWAEKLLRQLQPEEQATAKRPRIRDV